MAQLISFVLMAYSYLLIRTAIPTLPGTIPTHFNAAGVADGWGSPDTLWILLEAQALTSAVFVLVPFLSQRFPGAVHFGSRRLNDFPPEQRSQAASLMSDMAGYLNVMMNLFFVFMVHEMIRAATQAMPSIHVFWPLGLLLGGTIALTLYHLRQFRRIAEGGDSGGTAR